MCAVRVALASEAIYTEIYVVLIEMRVIMYNEVKCVVQDVVRLNSGYSARSDKNLGNTDTVMWVLDCH